jgi:UDP-hydrolysing UDP-N-acetyl-D-glucosamine 2-epimerase
MHLAPEFGETVQTIEADGFRVDARIEMLVSSDTPAGTAKSIGLGLIGFADAFDRLDPDIVVLIGDRFEMWAAAQAAFVGQRVLAHIHGGETTEGAFDEGIRHSLTKLSHYHFATAEPYRDRIVQLGEEPDRVFTVGAPGIDHIGRTPLLSRTSLATELGIPVDSPIFAVTLHPATLEKAVDTEVVSDALISALEAFPHVCIVITESNGDPGGRSINQRMSTFAANSPNVSLHTSLGQKKYLSLIREADVVVGNSSSGIFEAPALGTPTVNVGSRQAGRLRAASIIDCPPVKEKIVHSIRIALSAEFRSSWPERLSLYGDGCASKDIVQLLRTVSTDNCVVSKTFFDITENEKWRAGT